MTISREEVRHLALLVRLGLSEDDVLRFSGQLSHILESFEILNEVDTSHVAPTANSIGIESVMREDEPKPCLAVEDVLANAPSRENTFFKVRPVLE